MSERVEKEEEHEERELQTDTFGKCSGFVVIAFVCLGGWVSAGVCYAIDR